MVDLIRGLSWPKGLMILHSGVVYTWPMMEGKLATACVRVVRVFNILMSTTWVARLRV